MMKTLVLGLTLLVLTIGVAPALAQTSTLLPATPPASSMDAPAGSDILTAPDVKPPDVNANVTARPNRGEDTTGAASPRTDTVRHFSIFGLSFTASIVLGAALLLGVIPAIVALTRTRGTPDIENTTPVRR
jgi:hypothetical protein